MDLNSITQIISTVGFPIAMCLMLFWYIKDMNEKHKDETDKFTQALNENTIVLQKLCDKLDMERDR